ncbi:MAG: homoserine dehydrogenase, partial [Cyclobacteriaceae bacterium]
FETGQHLLYEASSGGSIPIIRNLEEYYDNDLLLSVHGILNSSTNYVLSRLFNDGMDYDIALKQAQDLGYAESDPTLDLWGYDALYKLIIITAHAYGVFPKPNEVFNHGIQNISRYDIQFAKEKKWRIKQVATVRKIDDENITLFVMPQFVDKNDDLYYVDNEYNGVYVEAAFSDKQFFQGKGAGGYPTGSCVISDISANNYNYKYEYKKYLQNKDVLSYSSDLTMEVYLRYYSKRNLELFDFEDISARYESEEYTYVIGTINLSKLVVIKDQINKADVLLVSTGKYF